jgi:AcrR family transcriptional regulator
MAVAFTEREKEIIKDKLRVSAIECLKMYGVRKTTVDQLTKMSGISKGAFYLFYPSKEVLFFDVLEKFQEYIFSQLINNLNSYGKTKRQSFIDGVYYLFENVSNSFMFKIFENNEMEYLIRKLPEELITEHHSFDDILVVKLFESLGVSNSNDIELASATLRAIFMTSLHKQEIGPLYMDAIKLLITGVADQLIEEN